MTQLEGDCDRRRIYDALGVGRKYPAAMSGRDAQVQMTMRIMRLNRRERASCYEVIIIFDTGSSYSSGHMCGAVSCERQEDIDWAHSQTETIDWTRKGSKVEYTKI